MKSIDIAPKNRVVRCRRASRSLPVVSRPRQLARSPYFIFEQLSHRRVCTKLVCALCPFVLVQRKVVSTWPRIAISSLVESRQLCCAREYARPFFWLNFVWKVERVIVARSWSLLCLLTDWSVKSLLGVAKCRLVMVAVNNILIFGGNRRGFEFKRRLGERSLYYFSVVLANAFETTLLALHLIMKQSIKLSINISSWREFALSRSLWKITTRKGCLSFKKFWGLLLSLCFLL